MRIAIDCRTVLAHKTGDRTYCLNLLRGLSRLSLRASEWHFDLLLAAPDDEGVLPRSEVFHPVVIAAPNSRVWTLLALPIWARKERPDLVHLQYLAPYGLPCPYVTTIHDVVWRALPQTFPRLHRLVMNRAMPSSARRATRILTVSNAARQDIARYLRVRPSKISVTPNAVPPDFGQNITAQSTKAVRAKYGLGSAPYVLSVGVLQPRKNLPRLIEAFGRVLDAHPDKPHRLVIVGKKGWGDESHNSPPYVTTTGYVPDDDLPSLYAGATLFAYPSLYEGFGLPILEAMACDCPVLTSDCSSMPEVAGEAAQLVNPYSVEAIAQGLSRVLDDAGWQQELRQKGRARVAYFTVERQAQTTLEAYRAATQRP